MKKRLDGIRVAVLAADGFEEVEVRKPVRALRRAGADVRIISLRPGRIRGMNFIWRGRKLPVDDTVFEARPEDYGALLLPGGFVNPDLLRQSDRARDFVKRMDELGRPIATLCHGPAVLVSTGMARGRRLTSWPGIRDDLQNAGANWVDEKVVQDNNLVSSRGPEDLASFVPAMINLFAERAPQAVTELRRRARPVAWGARLVTTGLLVGAVAGGRAAYRRWPFLARRRPRSLVIGQVARDLGLASVFGSTLFANLVLDPAVRALPSSRERGEFIATTGRRFVLPTAIALGVATAGWLAERVQVPSRRRSSTVRNVLLTGAVVTGLLNLFSSARAGRLGGERGTRRESLKTGGQEQYGVGEPELRSRAGTVSGLAQAGLLAGLIGANAAARVNGR